MLKHLWFLLQQPIARVIGFVFFLNGFVFGSWAACIPYVKEKFNLDEASLGLLLLSMPFGVLIMNPLTVYLLGKFGLNRLLIISGLSMGFAFTIPVASPDILFVSVGLIISGCVFACENVAMNTYASNLEENYHLRLMSTCHGMWSTGAMSGALLSSFSPVLFKSFREIIDGHLVYFICISIFSALAILQLRKSIQSIPDQIKNAVNKNRSVFAMFRPKGTLLVLAGILVCTYLTEGTMADWSAVYMSEIIAAPVSMIGWGYAMYAGFMAGGRFIGDVLIQRYTDMKVLRIGGFIVIAGMLWIIISSGAWIVLPGFMLVGFGISLASPILYAASARVEGLEPGAGLATMNSFGMAAFLTGPVIVGFIAKFIDLRFAFVIVILTSVLWIILTRKLIRINRSALKK